jgi:hypothetical protein
LVGGAIEEKEAGFGGVVTEDGGDLDGSKAGGSGERKGVSRLKATATSKVF